MLHPHTIHRSHQRPRRRIVLRWPVFRRQAAVAAVLLVLALGGTLLGYIYAFPSRLGPAQPISFSHRVHASYKQISCLMCHTGVAAHEKAGLPPLETCMLCHAKIIIHHPEVQKVRAHYEQNQPVVWAKVTSVHDFVYFNHAAHIARGVDCSHCHGAVNQMDRVTLPGQEIDMGFCVTCHRQNQVSHDCLVCHR